MRIESPPGSRWSKRQNRKRAHLKPEALVDTHTASLASAERVWEKILEKAPRAGFGEDALLPFFLLMLKSWQSPTFRPIKIRKRKGGREEEERESFLKRQWTHPLLKKKKKNLLQKAFAKMFFSFEKWGDWNAVGTVEWLLNVSFD